ncbi:MAG: shikimate kinase [Candidatus Omnitrophica bacterium]|nr:shikimate kinase [Candidatus Omnitrophota bacterium]
MKNVYIVGFMGTGKTSVGKILANKLSKEFVEMDEAVEQEAGKKIKDIFAKEGEGYFRKLESNLLQRLSSQSDLVVSCGGGIVCNEDNLKILKNSGYVFALDASAVSIYARIKDSSQRPLLNVENPLEKIKQLLQARESFYARAGKKIKTDNLSAEEVADCILKLLKNG